MDSWCKMLQQLGCAPLARGSRKWRRKDNGPHHSEGSLAPMEWQRSSASLAPPSRLYTGQSRGGTPHLQAPGPRQVMGRVPHNMPAAGAHTDEDYIIMGLLCLDFSW